MDDDLSTIILLIILMALSAFFTASQTAFSLINKARIKAIAESGDKKAKKVVAMLAGQNRIVSSLVVGKNIANVTVSGVAMLLFVSDFGIFRGAFISIVIMSVVILIFCEISPKTIVKEHPEKFAMALAPAVNAVFFLLRPVNYIFSLWENFMDKIFKPSKETHITEEDILTLIDEAEQEGAIDEEDKQLINSVIEFNDCKVSEILTPRVDVIGISVDSTDEEISKAFGEHRYTRLPVYDGSLDSIIGVIHLRNFYEIVVKQQKTLKEIINPVVFIAPNTKITDLLKTFQIKKCLFGVVMDEYGGTMGIITMEDILEELVGEIWDEHDEIIQEITQVDEKTYKVICSGEVENLFDFFKIHQETEATTISGWIVERLTKIPEEGDSFEHENLYIKVTKTDHKRVLECIVAVTEQVLVGE